MTIDVTPSKLRIAFPEFRDQGIYPNDTINYWIGVCTKLVGEDRWEDLAEMGVMLATCHHIALSAKAVQTANAGGVPGMNVGVLSGRSVDKVNLTYDVNVATEQGAGFWNQTTYGTRYWHYVQMFGAGPLQCGTPGYDPTGGAGRWCLARPRMACGRIRRLHVTPDDFKKISSVKVTGQDLTQVHDALRKLVSVELLLGVPEAGTDRADAPITNAAIGYISEMGAPERNIPARPWLLPGVRESANQITSDLRALVNMATQGKASAQIVDKAFHVIGMKVVSHIKQRISDGLGPPLADSTLYQRARRGDEGAAWELSWRATGVDLLNGELAKPLIDTGNFLASINYVVAPRRMIVMDLDMSDAFCPENSDSFVVTRQWSSLSKGRNLTSPINMGKQYGVICVAGPNDISRLPQGTQFTRGISITTRFHLQAAIKGYQPDLIDWNGSKFMVMHVAPYGHVGSGFGGLWLNR